MNLWNSYLSGRALGLNLDLSEASELKRIWSNLVLGLWLMLSPFTLAFLNSAALKVVPEDLLLGFGIATFSLCRLMSRRREDMAVADWLITVLGALTLINPILYSYYNVKPAAWNNFAVGAIVLLLAIYQDRKDFEVPPWRDPHHRSR